jgi:hypothetical protein
MTALKSLSSLLMLALAQSAAYAAVSAQEAKVALKALTRSVEKANQMVGTQAAAKASMLWQLRTARQGMGEIQGVRVDEGTTAIQGSNGYILLEMPMFRPGATRGGSLSMSVTSASAGEGEPRRHKTSVYHIGTNGVVNSKVVINALSADGKVELGVVSENRRDFQSAALSDK